MNAGVEEGGINGAGAKEENGESGAGTEGESVNAAGTEGMV